MTTSSLSFQQQHVLLDSAKAAVASFTGTAFAGFFTAQDKEDIVGNAMEKACRYLYKYDASKSQLATWVSKIAINCVFTAADNKRKRLPISQSMIEMDEDGDECNMIEIYGCSTADYDADRDIDYKDFERSVTKVTDGVQGINRKFLLMIEDGMTPKQMAQATGCTPDAASVRKCKILKGIKEPIREIALEFDVHNGKLAC